MRHDLILRYGEKIIPQMVDNMSVVLIVYMYQVIGGAYEMSELWKQEIN